MCFQRYTKALENIRGLRKDRVAELKAEKERLESLSREKAHADKLRARISELSNTIHAKEIAYEETKKEYDEVVDANNKYHQQATRFREIYIKVENLEETQKILKEDLANTRINVPEIKGTYLQPRFFPFFSPLTLFTGSEDELRQRVERFDENISAQKQLRRTEEAQLQDSEEELSNSRKSREVLVDEVSGLNTEAKVRTGFHLVLLGFLSKFSTNNND